MQIRIRRGLFFPATPPAEAETAPSITSVAVRADEHAGLHARLEVHAGDLVHAGQTLFSSRNDPDVVFVSPVAGQVHDIHMGSRRKLLSVVVETNITAACEASARSPGDNIDTVAGLSREQIRRRWLESGLWPAIRQRPGDTLAPSAGEADVLLVSAIDTQPWAADPVALLEGQWSVFWAGVAALSRFARHATWVCAAPGFPQPPAVLAGMAQKAEFQGPHPAGLVGTHLGHLAPLSFGRRAWYVDCQDVAEMGRCLVNGERSYARRVCLSGPDFESSRMLLLPEGADASGLPGTEGLQPICGSLLAGRPANPPFEHLGRFHRQVTVLPQQPAPFGTWLRNPAPGRPARVPLGPVRPLAGGMLAHDGLDRTWALGVPPTPLLRALMTGDYDRAVEMGCLDLGEEDLAIASLACAGEHDYGAYLREALDALSREHAR